MRHWRLTVDPFAPLLEGKQPTLESALDFTKQIRREFHEATALRVDARVVHEAGGGEAQELAYMLAAGVALLRAGEGRGLAPNETGVATLFTIAVGPDVIVEIAKLRAARLLWAAGTGGVRRKGADALCTPSPAGG
ncbi:MAG: methylmalonyl-CoA mutase family protein [Alphaproteobacteria bacterium]